MSTLKTITFATTQMNLINCVEYLSTITGSHSFVLMADNPVRARQIKELLNNVAYSSVFRRIYYCPNTNKRIINFLLTFIYHFRLAILSRLNKYDVVVTGNYKNYSSRFLYKMQSNHHKCDFVVCDDGLATTSIAMSRIEEIKTNVPYIFCSNRIIKWYLKNNRKSFIPTRITYYTSYDIPVNGADHIIKNHYHYIKGHLDAFNVDKNVFNCSAIMLGQPLYSKLYVSSSCYIHKLEQYAETVTEKIVYYSHPEEEEKEWKELNVTSNYIFIKNFLPFEIIASLLPRSCRVVSFFSSVLVNLRLMNESLIPECIVFSKDELTDLSKYPALLECYNCYQQENVKFYEFDN